MDLLLVNLNDCLRRRKTQRGDYQANHRRSCSERTTFNGGNDLSERTFSLSPTNMLSAPSTQEIRPPSPDYSSAVAAAARYQRPSTQSGEWAREDNE